MQPFLFVIAINPLGSKIYGAQYLMFLLVPKQIFLYDLFVLENNWLILMIFFWSYLPLTCLISSNRLFFFICCRWFWDT